MTDAERGLAPARELWTLTEPLHAVVYFTPEASQALRDVGLSGFWRGYFASRVAPLGRAEPPVVTTLFAGFAPGMVERAIPSVWQLAAPEQALAARAVGSGRALARLLAGLDTEVAEAAELLTTVVATAPTAGRALGAANAALSWPTDPHEVLWQAATTLRELRGDGHVLAQVAFGLDGLSTMVLRTGIDLPRELLQGNRGWTDDEWEATRDELATRGLLEPDGDQATQATQAGRALLERVETLTDELAAEPWSRAGDEVRARYRALASVLVDHVLPALPETTPIGLPRRPDPA